MASSLSITRTFSTAVTVLLSWLDDNFTTIKTWADANCGGAGTDTWNNAAKAGGYTPSTAPGASQIVVLNVDGDRQSSSEVVEKLISTTHRQFGGNDRITVVKGKTNTIFAANAKFDDGTWKFIGTGYAMRMDLDISTPSAPMYYESTASGSAGGAITWTAAQTFALGTAGASAQADTLKELVSGLYRQASTTPAANNIPVVNASNKLAVTATNADVASSVTDGANSIKTKVIEIGDWNMDATANISVLHGIASNQNIRRVSVLIRQDAAPYTLYPIDYSLAGVQAGNYETSGATLAIVLSRTATGMFDQVTFDSTSFNRGWVTITYVE